LVFYLLWGVRRAPARDLTFTLSLVAADGKVVARWTGAPIAFYPTSRWERGEMLKAYYDLQLPSDLPQAQFMLTGALGSGAMSDKMIPIAPVQIAP
jgi:hypothetical protein